MGATSSRRYRLLTYSPLARQGSLPVPTTPMFTCSPGSPVWTSTWRGCRRVSGPLANGNCTSFSPPLCASRTQAPLPVWREWTCDAPAGSPPIKVAAAPVASPATTFRMFMPSPVLRSPSTLPARRRGHRPSSSFSGAGVARPLPCRQPLPFCHGQCLRRPGYATRRNALRARRRPSSPHENGTSAALGNACRTRARQGVGSPD